jgi:hypothetical protein
VFGRKARIRKAVDRAIARLEQADDLADHAPIEALPEDHRAQTYGWLANVVSAGEWYPAAQRSVAGALALAPEEVALHQLAASIAIEIGDRDEAIAAQRRVVAMQPSNAPSAAALAEMLIDADPEGGRTDALYRHGLLIPFSPGERLGQGNTVMQRLFSLLAVHWSPKANERPSGRPRRRASSRATASRAR